MKRKVEAMEELREGKEERKFYQAVRRMRNGFQPRMNVCRDRNGAMLGDDTKVLSRWAEHFEETLNTGCSVQEEEQGGVEGERNTVENPDSEPPSFEEFEDALTSLKNNRAPGEDNIPSEILKCGGDRLHQRLYNLILGIWINEKMPSKWCSGLILPIFKKGDKTQCQNYRGITLLNVAYKILSRLLVDRLKVYSERILADYQCGFRPNRGTADQIFVVKQILEKCYERNQDVHLLFVDYQQAFDRVSRPKLFKALEEFQIPYKLINLIKMTMAQTQAIVLVGNQTSQKIKFNAGVRQGDALSAILFNLILHKAIGKIVPTGNLSNRTSQIAGYADDIAILSRSENALKELLVEVDKESKKVGLMINERKTKYMVVSTSEARRRPHNLVVGNYCFEAVDRFTYLGVEVNRENKVGDEIRSRIIAGNRAYFGLQRLIKSNLLTRQTKLKVYKSLIRPIVCYGAEAWTLNAADQLMLRVFERKILRRIYGPVCPQGTWRIRNNKEIDELIRQEDIVRFIKARRISWLGHVERLPDGQMVKRIMKEEFQGTRRRGRPRTGWMRDVEKDLRKLGVTAWRTKAQDRDTWKKIVREAKVHPEL